MNHNYLIRLIVLKYPGFQSQKYGMPRVRFQVYILRLLCFYQASTALSSCVTVQSAFLIFFWLLVGPLQFSGQWTPFNYVFPPGWNL